MTRVPVRASRMSVVGTETAFEVLAEVKRLEAQGRRIYNFAIGEPDFDTPEHIKQAGIAAIRDNYTHYSPSAGIQPLREAIARVAGRLRGLRFSADEVVVTPGAKPIIYYTLLSCVDPGDEVIYPNPGFPIYESAIRLAGAVPVPLYLREHRGFVFDPDELSSRITPRTRLVILNSPHNPTGGVLSREVLAWVAQLAVEHDLWVLSDEIYSRILFDGEFVSIAALPDMRARTIVLDGFSKIYAMTGWRLGYGIMPAPVAADVARLVTNVESCTATFTQMAGIAALEGPQEPSEAMVAEFRARRDLVVELLDQVPGVRVSPPSGAFYVYPNVTEACRRVGAKDAREFASRMLHEAGVALLAGTAFGTPDPEEDQQYVRLSYAASREQLREGIARMREWVEKGGAR
ncbi:pyridoxal phosphate-dependent aminotransferase [Carboxydochorda subterranea]|uniref:Aminotransferase n=1 Tax=Carboxydichorda subterranea TaxID=3109565 RepID=A0ABZ1BYM5_9FIRM|nr:pyridoxal phosphate-dependent aminotransferase [Limnochorda sp. L945t]WRP17839.1 pyridoxal phosphate-dependent aminotransferase [Limnochorda sp. L945t]